MYDQASATGNNPILNEFLDVALQPVLAIRGLVLALAKELLSYKNDLLIPSSIPRLDYSILDHVLQDFMQDSSARFRSSHQREAFYLLLLRIPYCFIILPTAGGKTTLFLIGASFATSQMTIIISPLIALKIDLFNKAVALT